MLVVAASVSIPPRPIVVPAVIDGHERLWFREQAALAGTWVFGEWSGYEEEDDDLPIDFQPKGRGRR
jgi:hypothetical protein